MKRITRIVVLGLTLVLALASVVFAQTQITTGVIQGTVLDEQGSVVPGANVEVRNPDTWMTTPTSAIRSPTAHLTSITNKYFSFDWRLSRQFRFGERMALEPTFGSGSV